MNTYIAIVIRTKLTLQRSLFSKSFNGSVALGLRNIVYTIEKIMKSFFESTGYLEKLNTESFEILILRVNRNLKRRIG